MINNKDITKISKLLNNKDIVKYHLISNSFNINCMKIHLSNKKIVIAKYYTKKKNGFNAINSEAQNLKYLHKKKLNIFPKIIFNDDDYLITEFIDNNKKIPSITKKDFLESIIKIHSISNKFYGFKFNTQIGGLVHKNKPSDNWVKFFLNTRLYYIFNIANKSNPMDSDTNNRIEILLKKINDFIPKTPKPLLLHGDLWGGNILFKDHKFVKFIDPGSFYGHNEMELAYLRWFNPKFIDKKFLEKYNEYISIDKNYLNYEPVYQLYYALCNVALWDKSYIKEVKKLLTKIGI